MTRRSLEIRVGLVVVIASTILIIGIMWFQQFKLGEKRYSFFASFADVGGLSKDDPIMVNGVQKGRVKEVSLHEHGVVVEMGVVEGVRIPSDAKVVLRSIGIMGERFVAIAGGTASTFIAPGDTVEGILEAGMSEVMGEAGRVLAEFVTVTRDLRKLVEAVGRQGELGTTMENLRAVSRGLSDLTAGEDSPLPSAVRHLEQVASTLDSLITSKYSSLDSSLIAFGRVGPKLEELVDQIALATADIQEITKKLSTTGGSLGQLINDDSLINKLDETVEHLDQLIKDVKTHPGRYLTIRLF